MLMVSDDSNSAKEEVPVDTVNGELFLMAFI